MGLNFGSFNAPANTDGRFGSEPQLTEGIHTLFIEDITELKQNKGGNMGFMVNFAKDGYKRVMEYFNLTSDPRSLQKIVTYLAAFGLQLERRNYSEAEIHNLFKSTTGKKCEVEIVLRHRKYNNKDGELIEGDFPSIAVIRPAEQQQEEDEVELEEVDLTDF